MDSTELERLEAVRAAAGYGRRAVAANRPGGR